MTPIGRLPDLIVVPVDPIEIELLRRTVGVNPSAGEYQNEALALK
jgi:hypothetical protein